LNKVVRMPFDERDLLRRAFAAWYRTGGTDQPAGDGEVRTVGGLTYVRLVNLNGILAVYRVESSGRLKRLKRFPNELHPG
jgi:hypothetical protein